MATITRREKIRQALSTRKRKISDWWAKTKQALPTWVKIVVPTLIVVLIVLAVWRVPPDAWPAWTGLGEYYSPPAAREPKFERAKNLWDWLQLFIVPLLLAYVVYVLNQAQQKNEDRANEQKAETNRQLAAQKAETDRQLAAQKAEADRKFAEQKDEADRKFAERYNLDFVLGTYFDRISALLIEQNLNSQPTTAVQTVARIWTLTVMRRLDGDRNQILIQFLRDAGLLDGQPTPIINMSGAVLGWADLRKTDLRGVDLHKADLHKAKLHEAILEGANLEGAILEGATYSNTTQWPDGFDPQAAGALLKEE